MRKIHLRIKSISYCLFFLFLISIIDSKEIKHGSIHIKISGLENKQGQILIALHNKPETFPTNPEKSFKTLAIPSKHIDKEIVFKKIPFGVYAISVVHDENANGKLDFTLFIPKEKVGSSNDAIGFMGPPKFKDAKFTLNSGLKKLNISLN